MVFNRLVEINNLYEKCIPNALGCQIYAGQKMTLAHSQDYGWKRLKYPSKDNPNDLVSYNLRVHRHSFLLHHNLLPTDLTRDIVISHRCHNKRCINVHHLNAESQAVNNDRKSCVQSQQCIGHGTEPNCIF